MREMKFHDRIEYSFWGNVEYDNNLAAKLARDEHAKNLAREGKRVISRWVLRDQMKKYDGLGQYNGTIGHVYKLEVQI